MQITTHRIYTKTPPPTNPSPNPHTLHRPYHFNTKSCSHSLTYPHNSFQNQLHKECSKYTTIHITSTNFIIFLTPVVSALYIVVFTKTICYSNNSFCSLPISDYRTSTAWTLLKIMILPTTLSNNFHQKYFVHATPLKLSSLTPIKRLHNPYTYTCATNFFTDHQNWQATPYHKLCTYILSYTAHYNLMNKNPSCLKKYTTPHHSLTPKQKPCTTIKILHLRAAYLGTSAGLTTHRTSYPATIKSSHASILVKKSKHIFKRIQYISISLPSTISHSHNWYVSPLHNSSFYIVVMLVSHTNTELRYFLTSLSHIHHIFHMACTKIVARLSDQPSMS
jgi:hypothetical protein